MIADRTSLDSSVVPALMTMRDINWETMRSKYFAI
jgi:hypothetical protein